jgi:hypothetical protein
MNEPTNNAREKLGSWIVRLEIALIFAGALVVGGLLIEEWRELSAACHEQRWPSRETTGNILVTFGVLLEVVIAAVIARLSRKSEKIADREIAELNERASQLDLARAKIEEELFKQHVITPEMHAEIQGLLEAFSGAKKRVDVFVYDQHLPEASMLADSINGAFRAAGWDSKIWIGAEPRMMGSEVIFSVLWNCPPSESQALQILGGNIAALLFIAGIGVSYGVGGPTRKPLASWGDSWNAEDVAMLRIQVGQRQIRSDLFNLRSQFKKDDAPQK